MSDEVFFGLPFLETEIKDFVYFTEQWEEEEITSPRNETEEELLGYTARYDEVRKYTRGDKQFYQFETRKGNVLYGQKSAIEELFPNPETWGEFYSTWDEIAEHFE